jgi:hypothetical protein
MRKSITWLTPAAVVSVVALTALSFDRDVSVIQQARAAALEAADSEARCPLGDATLRGTYMVIGGGTVVGYGPVAFVGKLAYDGKGHITKVSTVSFAGVISTSAETPTYTVHSDCTGNHTSGDGTQHYNFVVNPDGSKLEFIETDAGTAITGTATRMAD